jgi:hypothetical protein
VTLVAVALLAACGTMRDMRDSVTYAPIGDTVASQLRTGTGKVSYVVDPTGPVDGISAQHLVLNMDDGSQQHVQRRGQQIAMGEHVRITSSNIIQRDRFAHRATQ